MMQHYLLLTPGPLTTSDTVKQAMLKDWCTWDDDYNLEVVQKIRQNLVTLAVSGNIPDKSNRYSSVLMQGSGTASVEAVIGSAIGKQDKLLVINNGAYGERIAEMARYLDISHQVLTFGETQLPDMAVIEDALATDPAISHVAMVHCETTTGMLNPLEATAKLCQKYRKVFILDAMSSFGGIEFDLAALDIGFMISSANKCIQGVPGFGFVIAKTELLQQCRGQARSLSLDLYAQWHTMESANGKWRFTSPTHVVRAFAQALTELELEGGITARAGRYRKNQQLLVAGMRELGFEPLLNDKLHSPIITSFYSPESDNYQFSEFYQRLKAKGFVIYPGKVSDADCFRIGNIGEIYPGDIERLLAAIALAKYW
ncbi:2-aminoethylphosphonate--pyruvate transaminase [Thalassomonas actiniarum]|uniref:2-aminoethylphosphonate--pyruvate transaminase n=1 Tax=Thalassomonas actiniarum TaxID=485447 RepID=A0AAF0C6W6_9GAMM|nr:2-aminoethylphosphonate--pyruvate transaminase [Thalassomonas actiniarum]WDE02731.1 2-aminoethylphosphonate--pyruvate transaminase [Thalassomonas actiniarum]